jgi:uridine kinase
VFRAELLETLAERIDGLRWPFPVRVAIDGVDGAGKTMFADELTEPLMRRGRPVIRASVDDFHRPRRERYRLGRDSPEGYFRDSFDYDALVSSLIAPLGPQGDRRVRRARFDHRRDAPVDAPIEEVDPSAVLVLDGIFLHRPELVGYWERSVFLDVSVDLSVARAAARDGGSSDPQDASNRRYVEGQRLYLNACDPRRAATWVVENEDLGRPTLWERGASNPRRVHVTGPSGSGTTTLGRALARRLGCDHFDADDYYWAPTDPPFTTKRPPEERVARLRSDLDGRERWVLSGSLVSWGSPLIPSFDVVVFLWAPTELRLERLARREREAFGADALRPGGKMHDNYRAFLDWAAAYDTADESMRSLRLHRAWLAGLPCPVLRLEGDLPTEVCVERVLGGVP